MGEFWIFVAVGFAAQLADGALGMGFGVISSSVLLGMGVVPPLVSAAVNAAKLPTGTVAGISHWLNGNIDRAIFIRVMLAGVAGGLCGALLLSHVKRPWLIVLIAVYLIVIGGLILWRGVTGRAPRAIRRRSPEVIGAAGGVIEGIGGSWGPVVTTSLLGAGIEPRRAIGSSALAELVVSATVFATLMVTFSAGVWGAGREVREILWPVAGLVAGGVPAAFLGGFIAARAPRRPLMAGVGVLALAIGLWRLWGLV